jgi:hypothetical protein
LTLPIGSALPRLDAERVLRRAQRRTGLGPAAGASLREPLARLIESCRREAQLTGLTQMMLAGAFTRLAQNALAVDKAHDETAATAKEPVGTPLFITGLPRSGTSFLQELLACDPAHRAPLAWETMCAVPHEPPRRRRARARLICGAANVLAPGLRRKHRLAALTPHECITIMAHRFTSFEFQFALRVPSYQTWLARQDLRPTYLYHRRFLQVLQRNACRVPRWILKAPSHLFALPALFDCYPDAHVLQLHRDPVISIASMASLTRTLRLIFSRSADAAEIGREQAELWAHGLAEATEFRAAHPGLAGRFHDLRFADLLDDPMAAMERLYAGFGWPLSDAAATPMRRYVATRQARPDARHSYTPEAFGLRPERVRRRFRDYSERFGVAAEA